MAPHVLVHILVRNGEGTLPLYLKCLEAQDYPKEDITLYIRTNDNTDNTESILWDWLEPLETEYRNVVWDPTSVTMGGEEKVNNHYWDGKRLDLIRHLRDKGFSKARDYNCDFYFTCDADNFIVPSTLSSLVETGLPVVAPMLRYAVNQNENINVPSEILKCSDYTSANFTNVVTPYGDVQNNLDGGEERFPDGYMDLLNRSNPGLHPVDLVHCCYLVNREVFRRVSYQNGVGGGYDYIILAFNFRYNGIQQWLDNRINYGCFTLYNSDKTATHYMKQLEQNELPEEWRKNNSAAGLTLPVLSDTVVSPQTKGK